MALVPLLVALAGWAGVPGVCRGTSFARGFLLGLLTGGVHFAGTVYWTGATVQTFGGMPWPVAVLVAGLLVLYMSLYVGLSSGLTGLFIKRFGVGGLLLAPACWVAFEYTRGWLFGGFPWIPLGTTMVTLLPLAQAASVVGVFGLSVLVVALNAGVAAAAMLRGRQQVVAVAGTLLLLVSVSVWGGMRLADNTLVNEGTPIMVGLVQGNIAQIDKWNPARAGMIVERYARLTQDAVARGAEFVLWPESSTPFYFDEDEDGQALVRAAAQQAGVPLLFGTDEIERPSPAPSRYFNSAFMLDPAGATAAVYRKMHLVPFGEYVPFKNLLFFVSPLVEGVSDFTPGERVTMLPVNGHMVSTAICYEITYPTLMREAVRQGSELLTTITNDAWYGESSAPFQHFDMATMRAIEQGRYLVRSANTGISGIVDPYGRVLVRTALGETTVVVGEARFVQARTLYATIGDSVPQAAVALVGAVLLVALLGGSRWRSSSMI